MDSVKLTSVLNELNSQFLPIRASAVLTEDGVMLADTLKESINKDTLAAMVSALKAFASKTTGLLYESQPTEQYIQCAEETLVITEALGGLLLVVFVNSNEVWELDTSSLQAFLSTKYTYIEGEALAA